MGFRKTEVERSQSSFVLTKNTVFVQYFTTSLNSTKTEGHSSIFLFFLLSYSFSIFPYIE